MSALPMLRPVLTPAAVAALETAPAEVLRRWFAGLGPAARAKYGLALRLFVEWATERTDAPPEDALRLLVDAGRVGARQLAIGWRDSMLAAGKATGTVAGLLSALASLVAACRLCGLVEWHLEKVSPRIEPREDRSGPPRHAVEQLVAHLEERIAAGTDRYAVRDLAIVRLLHGAALRRFEATGLRLCDVQLDADGGPRVLALRKGKREREPMLIGPMAADSLRAWLAVRGTCAPDAPVFVRVKARGADAGPMCGDAVRKMLAARAKQAGLRCAIRPHGLRHSAATHCARHSTLAALKRLGGWTTLSSPARYLDRDDRDRRTALAVVEV